MGGMASQITSLTIVCPMVHSGADQRKHQSSASLAFVQGIHRWPVNSPHKWPVAREMFPVDDVIMGECVHHRFRWGISTKFALATCHYLHQCWWIGNATPSHNNHSKSSEIEMFSFLKCSCSIPLQTGRRLGSGKSELIEDIRRWWELYHHYYYHNHWYHHYWYFCCCCYCYCNIIVIIIPTSRLLSLLSYHHHHHIHNHH